MASVIEHFSIVKDPRRQGYAQRHNFIEIMTIAICGVISGANNWVEVRVYAESNESWFRRFLSLENGIPSHDVFSDVFSAIDPGEFENAFLSWVKAISKLTHGQVIAIDGKALRRSYDVEDKKAAIYMVSAWANSNKLVLGQVKVDEKSNEITAIPKLLDMLAIEGCIVTIDAMGCQRKISDKILQKKADYVLALKGNQEGLLDDVTPYFECHLEKEVQKEHYSFYQTIEKDHGRIETRKCWVTDDIQWLSDQHAWPGIKTIVLIESTRQIRDQISVEKRYYISSLPKNSKPIYEAIRSHWGIENSLHWSLDVTFREDDSRIRKGFGDQNFSALRRIALNLLKNEKSQKVGLNAKRLKAACSNDYLLKVLDIL